MAFLDNAGDIILDAVLTDAGRQRLARGNFKIVKFALGDEEINYELFNSSHPSGSAFYDLEIMQTPVLEAFTNNTSLMKSKLVSINRNNILYMPILKVNSRGTLGTHGFFSGFDGYYLTADEKTSKSGGTGTTSGPIEGVMHGPANIANGMGGGKSNNICIDQGIEADSNTDGLSITDTMPADMLETAFLVRADHRLLRFHAFDRNGGTGKVGPELINQFVDDDAVATYFFAMADGTNTVFGPRDDLLDRGDGRGNVLNNLGAGFSQSDIDLHAQIYEMFTGPLGNTLRIVPKVAPSVQYSSTLFDKLGTTAGATLDILTDSSPALPNYKFIDTSINVTGVTTGYSVDLPIRIIKGIF